MSQIFFCPPGQSKKYELLTTKFADSDFTTDLDIRIINPQVIQYCLVVAVLLLFPVGYRLAQLARQIVELRIEIDQLNKILEHVLVVNGEPTILLLDVVVLNFALRFEAQREIAWVVSTHPHQIRTFCCVLQQKLGLFASQITMVPSLK